MLDSVTIDERNHDAGYALRCRHDEQLEAAKLEFIQARMAELMRTARLDCLMECDDPLAAINSLADAKGSLELFEAQDRFVATLRQGAESIATREWQGREATIAFGIMEDLRNGWCRDQ